MSKYKVVVVNLGYGSIRVERDILKPVDAELILAPNDCLIENDVISVAKETDTILVREAPTSARFPNSINRCKLIARYGVGVDNINLEAAKQKRFTLQTPPVMERRKYPTMRLHRFLPASANFWLETKLCGRGSSKRILTTPFIKGLGKT